MIFVVEDDHGVRELELYALRQSGYEAEGFETPAAFRQALEKTVPDCVLLDVMLPGCSGFEVKEQLDPALPVIFVTAKNNLSSRLQGLGLGADDYIVKPFEILELLARVEAVLRRVHAGAEVFDLGDCHVEFGTHRVFVAGHEVALTPQEFMLLGVLVRNRNLALSREKLLQLAWGYDYEGDTRTVDVHIQKLRKKLGFEDRIQTVYKLGYRLSTKE